MSFQFGYPGYSYNPTGTYIPQQQNTMQQFPTQQMQQPQQMAQAFACHPVTSREEAVAAQTDYFSAGLVMPDLSHGMIYLKRFNQQTGASDFYEFKAVRPEQKEETPEPVKYVTVEEFEKFRAELTKKLNRKGETKNDE